MHCNLLFKYPAECAVSSFTQRFRTKEINRSMDMHEMQLVFFLTVLVFMFASLFSVESAPQSSRVTSLPGFNGTFPSEHYSGYVTLGRDLPDKLFYYFVVSERNPASDPVVLWLNGGPGCSSFDGFIYEHGPFNFGKVKENGLPDLHLNPYSWSKVANIIYLDSPVGTGFSYTVNASLYDTSDSQTAADSHRFLLKWFKLFPEFNANPFYISGESYAGIYIPTLASEVVKGITRGDKPVINFKGYMVGNGLCDDRYDYYNALVPFAHGMGLISDTMFKEAKRICQGDYESPDIYCQDMTSNIYDAIHLLNVYDILEPCYHRPDEDTAYKNTSAKLPQSFKQLGATERPLPVRKRIFGRAWPFRAPLKDGIVPSWPKLMNGRGSSVPCVNDIVATKWLNNGAVRKAIHVVPESGEWSLCNDLFHLHDAGSMISYHKNIIDSGYRVLIYSGDHDMCVPFTGTEAWTQSLGYPVADEWRPWMVHGQVAGYLQGYANDFTFITIKGAGHTVPEYKPRESLAFFRRWLAGEPI